MFGQAAGVFGVDRHATGEHCRVRAHLRTALHGRVSSDRHEPVFVATHVATEEAEVHDHLHPVCSPRVLGDAHAPDQYRIFRVTDQFGKLVDDGLRQAGLLKDIIPRNLGRRLPDLLHIDGVPLDELMIQPVVFKKNLQHAVQEGDVASLRYREPVVSDVRAEQRAVGRGRNPVLFHRRFVVGIYQRDFCAQFFCLVQVLGHHRLIVRRVGTKKNDQVRAVHVRVTARRRGVSDCRLHGSGRG